jgi:predicted DNA-binding protein YlxM (UPF0122 family)
MIITSMYNKGYSPKYIARHLNIPLKKVYMKLVEDNAVPVVQLENRKFDDEDIIAIYNTYNAGMSLYRVAQMFDTDKVVITDILNKRSYKNVSERHDLEVTKCYNRNNTFEYSVAALVLAVNDGFPIMDISEIFDLPRPTIGIILKAYGVKAVDARTLGNSLIRKLKEEDIISMFNMRREKYSMREIAEKFNVSRQLVNSILKGRLYASVSEKHNLIQ